MMEMSEGREGTTSMKVAMFMSLLPWLAWLVYY